MQLLRNASTLILVAPDDSSSKITVLVLKRSATTSHFPNAYVFPGGNSESADSSLDWLSVLPVESLNVPLNIIGTQEDINLVATNQRISEAISLRITAIRETFEECGILLCKRKGDNPASKVSHLNIANENLWRKKVRQDAHEFLNLCRTYECFPDVCNLHFLSNWITPIHVARRYTCKFFITVLEDQVKVKADKCEIETAEWCLIVHLLKNTYLPPPQIYELSILEKFSNISDVQEFAVNINSLECLPYMPIAVTTKDGLVVIFPGDEKYQELDSQRSKILIDLNYTAEKFRGHVLHRIELIDGKGTLIIRNCTPRHYKIIHSIVSRKSKM